MKILSELILDASLSVPKLSKKISVNPSVAYSRIRRLIKRNLIKKFTIQVNEELLGYNVTAIIGMNIDSKMRDRILEELMNLDEIRDVSEVTGRFDLVSTARARSLDALHDMISGSIGKIPGVIHTETFIEMRKKARDPKYVLVS